MKALKFFLLLLMTVTVSTVGQAQSGDESDESYTFLFVHGAWGGGHDYKQMETILEDHGHEVFRPTMTGQGNRVHLNGPDVTLETHIQDILNVIEFERLENIVLVGHSYGGMVITGVADRVPEKFSHIIYVDAFLPEDGESLFSLSGSGERYTQLAEEQGNGYMVPPTWPDPWPDVPHPIGTLREPVSLEHQDQVEDIPASYILAVSENGSGNFSPYAERARERGWGSYEIIGGHNLHRDLPEELADVLLQSIEDRN